MELLCYFLSSSKLQVYFNLIRSFKFTAKIKLYISYFIYKFKQNSVKILILILLKYKTICKSKAKIFSIHFSVALKNCLNYQTFFMRTKHTKSLWQ